MTCKSLWLSLALLSCCTALTAADDNGFRPIFDGKSLEGWEGNPKFWRVENGAITGQTTADNPTDGNTFIIWRTGELEDFELKLKFRIVGGNSGIQYRSREITKWVMAGYQADIDSGDRYPGILYEEKARGLLALRGKKVIIDKDGTKRDVGTTTDSKAILDSIKKEDWNDYSIKAIGNHLIHSINGNVTVDVTDNQVSRRAMKGLLALQLHAGPPMLVQFKDVRLKELNGDNNASIGGDKKSIVLVAGRPSHGYGSHEHNAGCLLLARYLRRSLPNFETTVYQNGWPTSGASAFDNADAVIVYCDGGEGHMLAPHLDEFDQVIKRGVGLVCLHYAVEVIEGDTGDHFLSWLGGYFEANWSVNPHWTASFEKLPDHPITRGVEPFEINDEWYFHMRFRPEMDGVTPILSAHPPTSTMTRPDGPHSGNPTVRAEVQRGDIQHVAWASERPDGGRGFGFTGGHYHWNWGDDNFRQVVLNAIVWVAHGRVPDSGVGTPTPTQAELEANQDFPKPGSRAAQENE